MAMMNLSKKEKLMVLAAATVFIVIVLVIYVVGPALVHLNSIDSEIAMKKSVLAEDQELLAKYKAMGGGSANHSRQEGGAKNEEEALGKSLNEIEAVSRQSSFRILNLKPGTAKILGTHKEISFDIAGEGTLQSFSMFICGVETSEEPFAVKSFSISPESGQSDKVRISILLVRFL